MLTRSQMVSPRKQFGSSARPTAGCPSNLGVEGSDHMGSDRANWSSSITTLFLQLVASDIRKEGRTTVGMDARAWLRIQKGMKERRGIVLRPKQLKNKYQQLKKEWQAWQLLVDARKGATGLGFDSEAETFTAPDHFWEGLMLRNELVGKFKSKGLDNKELMEQVFADVTSGGRYAAAAAYDPLGEVNVELLESLGDTDDTQLPERMTQRMGELNSPSPGTPKNRRTSTGSGSQKRKSSSCPSVDLSATIQTLVESRATLAHTIHYSRKSLHHIGDAIRLLSDMPAFADTTSTAYQWVVNFLGLSPMMLDIFVELPSAESRLFWIEGQRKMAARTIQPGSAAHRAIPPSFLL